MNGLAPAPSDGPQPRSYVALGLILLATVALLTTSTFQAYQAQGTDRAGTLLNKTQQDKLDRLDMSSPEARPVLLVTAGGTALVLTGLSVMIWALARVLRGRPMLPDNWGEDPPWSPGHVLGLTTLWFLAYFQMASLARGMAGPSETMRWLVEGAARALMLLGIAAVIFITGGRARHIGITASELGKNIVRGLAAFAAFMALYIGLAYATNRLLEHFGIDPVLQDPVRLLFDAQSRTALACAVFFGVVVAPIVEEVFFRGFLQGSLRKRCGGPWGIVGTAALFGAIHGNAFAFLPVFVLGLVAGYVYDRTQSLVGPILIHAGLNTSVVITLSALRTVQGG